MLNVTTNLNLKDVQLVATLDKDRLFSFSKSKIVIILLKLSGALIQERLMPFFVEVSSCAKGTV